MTKETIDLITLLSLKEQKTQDTNVLRHCKGLKLALLNESIETLPYNHVQSK